MFLFDGSGKMQEININDVVCIKRAARERKIQFCTGIDWFHQPCNLHELEVVYKQLGFCQIDKNKLINVHKIERIEGGYVWTDSGKYPVSRRVEPNISNLLGDYPPVVHHQR